MQFVANGPDIPEALLQAHEEGRVVFFCGAGISYPADLPGFKGLVDQIYLLNGTSLSDIEQESYKRLQYDATLDLLERRLPGQRLAVRRALAKSLEPKLDLQGATDTQAALLRLARSRDGALRLVTTNFDRIFHEAADRTGQPFQAYAAPMLPIPKNSRWDGLVFLHGLLPEGADDTALNRLVATSGDFGLAYLTERWAARFVSELFRNYVVCFIGYSINDPVLRYMMDALAADRMLGEITPQAWALGDCEEGKEADKTLEWRAKGVAPVLYKVPAGSQDHSSLHQTLHVWAETYRDGVQGKEAIVVKHAMTQPQESTLQDDFVGRMLWALSDKSGLPAKRFADFNPVPSLDWLLEPFAQERFFQEDLVRFGVATCGAPDSKLRFSLVRRPTSHDRAPFMLLVSGSSAFSQWDPVMFHLARWLVRHLDDPRLLIWVAERGGQLHERWAWLIGAELERLAKLQSDGNTAELDALRQQAPRSIPSPWMHTLWALVLGGRVKEPWSDKDLYRWTSRFKREGLTTTLRLDLRNLLTPRISLRRPFLFPDEQGEVTRLRQLVEWELVLAADHVRLMLPSTDDLKWKAALPLLLPDFQQLLRDGLDLSRELGEADDRSDRSYWDLPSISPHRQNRGYRAWVSIIELTRDAWLAIRELDGEEAAAVAKSWFSLPYPTFKRLALFAASQAESISSEQWVNWLLADDAWWLWYVGTRREGLRLLVLKGHHLTSSAQERLEEAIILGPPRKMFRDDLEPEAWAGLVEHAIWLRLAKLEASGLSLGASASSRLSDITALHPKWTLAANEQDEFSHWTSGTGDPDFEDSRDIDLAPRKRSALREWLSAPLPENRPLYEDNWREVSRTRFFHSLSALRDLADENVWPSDRWREALSVWSDDDLILRSWRFAAPLVQRMPDAVISSVDHAVTWWMQAASKMVSQHREILIQLSMRVLSLPLAAGTAMTRNGEPIDEPVNEAINHPVGHVTQALLNIWFKQNPNDNDLLPAELEPAFSALCDPSVERFRYGRTLLASRLVSLFRVDRMWTEDKLLSFFDWRSPVEARAVWSGFLWSPRLYPPLLEVIKPQFLEAASHYSCLSEHRQQYSAFLTYVALGHIEGYTSEDFSCAVAKLPQEGLEECAQALGQALEGAADQREEYWENRVAPFWQKVWPKSLHLATPQIAASLARMAIAARGEFPAALAKVRDWLQPIDYPDHIVYLLHESGLCIQHPVDALSLLDVVISARQWPPMQLRECLDQIKRTEPAVANEVRFVRLDHLTRG